MDTRHTRPVSEPAATWSRERWCTRQGLGRTLYGGLSPLVSCACVAWLVAAAAAAAELGSAHEAELVVERPSLGQVAEETAAAQPASATAIGVAVGAVSEAYNNALEGGTSEAPLVVGVLQERVERQLALGYRFALQRVREVEACQDLFASLGADGAATLSTTIYLAPIHAFEVSVCEAGAAAFTFVGAPQTRLCYHFGTLSRQQAAVLLIHEALHHAGLSERPNDPDGMTPHQIDRMVARACGL